MKGFWLLLACSFLATPLWAQESGLPEVLLVVDTSQSMQYRVGANELPLCGSTDTANPDQKSRWNVVREAIGGSFASFQCSYEPLNPIPEAVNPPTQLLGTQMCIPGIGMTLETPYQVRPVLGSVGVASRDFPAGATGPDDPAASFQTTYALGAYTLRTMWMRFDLSSIPQDASWVGTVVDVPGTLYNTDPEATSLQLVLVPSDPPQIGSDLCGIAQAGQQVLSGAVALPWTTVSGLTTTLSFSLTNSANTALQALRQGGATTVTVAIVPAQIEFDGGCGNPSGFGALTNVTFAPSSTSGASSYSPSLTVATGELCPAEGPTKHSIGLGVQGDGSVKSITSGVGGLLFDLGQSAKFALLTGDNVMNKGTSKNAGYSYADEISSLWGTINMGLADPLAAVTSAVPITRPDTLVARKVTYAAIQSQLQAARPNGPTPLGSALTDLLAYIGPGEFMDPHFRSIVEDSTNGDPYQACRKRIAVLFTDGGANLHNGQTPGQEGWVVAKQAAALLHAQNIPLYVLAVGIAAADTPTSPEWAFLNELAINGGTDKAYLVSEPQDAVAALAPAIEATALRGLVLTRPNYTTATGIAADVQHTFQAKSIFDLSQPLRTRGVIEQRIFKCDAACVTDTKDNLGRVCKILNYADILKDRTKPRQLWTHLTGDMLALDTTLSPFYFGIGNSGAAPHLELQPDSSCQTTNNMYQLNVEADQLAYRDEVVANLRGDAGTCRQNHPLGAPSRAQPAVLEPANRLPVRDPTYKTYAATPKRTVDLTQTNSASDRPTMLFAATHDGLLHAFRTDEDPLIATTHSDLAGDEMWAYLPRFSLSRVSQITLVTNPDASLLNAPITTGHVLLQRTLANGVTTDATATNWRAVVVVGAGISGAGYSALDVTQPDDPKLLWEISPDQHCFGNVIVQGQPGPTCKSSAKFSEMGRSTARPVLTTLYYTDSTGVAAERAVAVIPFGRPSVDTGGITNLGIDGSGERGVYVLDMRSGDIIRKFMTADISTTGAPFDVPDKTALGMFWTEPACYNNAPGQVSTRCFLGDSKGMVWRMDVSAVSPADWTFTFFFDLYNGASLPVGLQLPLASSNRMAITSPPSLSTSLVGVGSSTTATSLAVLIGSGNGDTTTTAAARDVVVSLRETYTLAADGSSGAPHGSLIWLKWLADGERFVGPPLVFANNAYWATYTAAKTGLCDSGDAWLWGVRFDRRNSVSDPQDTLGVFKAVSGGFVSAVDQGAFRPSPVDLQPQAACTNGCPPTSPSCVLAKGPSLGGGAAKYDLSIAVADDKQGANQTPKAGNAGTATIGTAAVTPPQPKTAAVITGWDLLID